jgi:hypothetical protein
MQLQKVLGYSYTYFIFITIFDINITSGFRSSYGGKGQQAALIECEG